MLLALVVRVRLVVLGMMGDLHKNKDAVLINPEPMSTHNDTSLFLIRTNITHTRCAVAAV